MEVQVDKSQEKESVANAITGFFSYQGREKYIIGETYFFSGTRVLWLHVIEIRLLTVHRESLCGVKNKICFNYLIQVLISQCPPGHVNRTCLVLHCETRSEELSFRKHVDCWVYLVIYYWDMILCIGNW